MDSPESEGLVSRKGGEQTAGAVREFASSASSTQRVQLGASDRTLEELVKELLRPMLKDWLDNNLQPIILRAVESEIAKLAERADED
jgi:cell pole-organizing protein PopZ